MTSSKNWALIESTEMITTEEKKLLLLVDDDPVNIHVVHSILKDDYKIRVATNGAKALDLAKTEPLPDLILLDVMMPEMDGYEATRAIRRQQNDRNKTAIVALTANARDEDRARCVAAGMDDFITKPLDLAQLADCLAKWAALSPVGRL